MEMEKVILAFSGERNGARIRELLESAGVAQCLVCHSAAEVKRLVRRRQACAVICGYKLPDETAESLFEDLPAACSMLVIATQDYLELIPGDHIFKVAAPVSRGELLSCVEMLLQVGRRMAKYARPQRSSQEQALIEEAKGMLMERRGMTEAQAHSYLQKKSMDCGTKLAQTAQLLLSGTWSD